MINILQQKCLNKWIGRTPRSTILQLSSTYTDPIASNSALLNHRHWCHEKANRWSFQVLNSHVSMLNGYSRWHHMIVSFWAITFVELFSSSACEWSWICRWALINQCCVSLMIGRVTRPVLVHRHRYFSPGTKWVLPKWKTTWPQMVSRCQWEVLMKDSTM